MANLKKFTDTSIKNIKPTTSEIWLHEGRGFYLRIYPSGSKHFWVRYNLKGKYCKLSLGEYPHISLAEARRKFQEILDKAQKGIAPTVPVDTPDDEITVEEIIKGYLKWSEKNHTKKWHNIVKWSLAKHVSPKVKQTAIAEIRKRQAIKIVEGIVEKSGAGAAKTALKAIQGVFKFAVDRDYIIGSPFTDLTTAVPALRTTSRSRVLSVEEIKTSWNSIIESSMSKEIKKALLLILITAQRPSEALGIHQKEIEGVWWTIPQERAQKGNLEHRVYLTRTARLLTKGTGFIFPSPKEGAALLAGGMSRGVAKANWFDLPRWTPHDLRRTARTHLARLGVVEEVAEAVVNHTKQGVVKVYNLHKYDKEKRQALRLWEKELYKIVGKEGYRALIQLCTAE